MPKWNEHRASARPTSSRARPLRLFAIGSLASLVACTLAVGSDRKQCNVDRDCARFRGDAVCVANACVDPIPLAPKPIETSDSGASDPVWGCIGKVPSLPTPEPTAPFHYYAFLQDLITKKPLVGLSAKACLDTDPSCERPLKGSAAETDSAGLLNVPLYSGFRGYIDIPASPAFPDLMPSLHHASPVPDKNRPENSSPYITNLLTRAQFALIVGVSGKTVSPAFGHFMFVVLDCQGNLAGGVVMRPATITADTFSFYTDSSGTPSLTQAETSVAGVGGFANLPAGTVTMTATRQGGQRVGSMDIIVRADTISYVFFVPTP